MHILIVEDEERIAGFLKKGLVEESYAVDVAPDRIADASHEVYTPLTILKA